jgi:hypothetical protein
MKKILILLAVAALPLTSGCCCTRLCPCCPCNWFSRAPVCAPAPTYVAPLAASPCSPAYAQPYAQPMAPSCAPTCPAPCSSVGTVAPMAASVMPQYMAPPAAPVYAQAQPMYYQAPMPTTCCGAAEPNCSYAPTCGCGGYGGEPGCGGPFMGSVSYGPIIDCGGCGGCGGCSSCGGGCSSCGGGCSGCSNCDGGAPTTAGTPPVPTPEGE